MQEPQIGWPPEVTPMPWQSRFLALYLLAALGVGLAKSISLAEHLWWFWPRRFGFHQDTDEDSMKANRLATSALANRKWSRQPDFSLSLRQVQLAETVFRYRQELCSAEIGSLERLALLTLLLSTFALVTLAIELLSRISLSKSYGIAAFLGGMAQALTPLALGVFVCAVLYAVASWHEGMLARRRASWNYFCARIKKQSAGSEDV